MWRLGLLCAIFLGAVSARAQDTVATPDYYADVFVDNQTPYVGQQITYHFRFYDAIDVPSPDYKPPDFEGFWQISNEQVKRSVQAINGRQYTISELSTALYPTRAGSITIEPAFVVLPQTVYRSQETISTPSLAIHVQPLPGTMPETFGGAVGQFELSAALDRQSISLGEPITLQLTVSGTGDVEQLSLPQVPAPAQWRIYGNPTTYSYEWVNGHVSGKKVYEYLLFPDQIGSVTLPSLTWSYFDPSTLSYRSITTAPMTIETLPPTNSGIQSTTYPNSVEAVLKLKPLSLDTPRFDVYPALGFWILWLFPPLGFFLSVGYAIWRRRHLRNRNKVRNLRALAEAQNRLQHARNLPSETVYPFIQKTIYTYFDDKLSGRLETNPTDLFSRLAQVGISDSLRERIDQCLKSVNEGQYAPINGGNIAEFVDKVESALVVVDQNWEKS